MKLSKVVGWILVLLFVSALIGVTVSVYGIKIALITFGASFILAGMLICGIWLIIRDD